jgi:hypothetical protein
MPANYGLWLDDDEDVSLAGPESEEGDPESPISVGDPRTRLLLGVDGELLAEGQLDEGLAMRMDAYLMNARNTETF